MTSSWAKVAGGMPGRAKTHLVVAIVANLTLLAYYKYANFFVANLNEALGSHLQIATVMLPLGISFFTFTQIAFLVDTYKDGVREYRFVHYALFVTYFPHLIAGPVLHHKEMMPQFGHPSTYRPHLENLAVGLTIFTLGLFKKVVLADGIAPHANDAFGMAVDGEPLSLFVAWGGALAYTLQLYFDFSAYSDMAVGLSKMLGIRMPVNFESPYKATSVIEFWRRWHMSLSTWIRDYLYIPLGGNHCGRTRALFNLVLLLNKAGKQQEDGHQTLARAHRRGSVPSACPLIRETVRRWECRSRRPAPITRPTRASRPACSKLQSHHHAGSCRDPARPDPCRCPECCQNPHTRDMLPAGC
jgi:alginate O-acetyltransferase complex protein AlgI